VGFDLGEAQQDMLFGILFFGSLIVGALGLWLRKKRPAWGYGLIGMTLAVWAVGITTEYLLNNAYCNKIGAELTLVRKRTMCSNGVKPPPIDWSRAWSYLSRS